MLRENICDRCDRNQTAGIVTKSGAIDYSPDRLIQMLLSQARCIQGVPGGMCQTSGECSLC